MDKAAFGLILLFTAFPVNAQKIQAALNCTPAQTDFIFDCVIKLSRANQPLPGAAITIGADMPSMPMAHNVKPVQATPGKAPGEYAAKLDLEMLGEWAVKLRLRGPVNDQLILLYEFDEKGAQPVRRGDRRPRN